MYVIKNRVVSEVFVETKSTPLPPPHLQPKSHQKLHIKSDNACFCLVLICIVKRSIKGYTHTYIMYFVLVSWLYLYVCIVLCSTYLFLSTTAN